MNEESEFQSLCQHFEDSAEAWGRIGEELRATFADSDDTSFQRERPATKFILTWMRELKGFQDNFGKAFRRQKRPDIADDFTAAVAITLEQFLTARGFERRVRSEQTTHRMKGATRPDVSILSLSDTLVGTVECKTDFGWKRLVWKDEFRKRTHELRERFPGCESYLCVLCNKRWDSAEAEKGWVCLSRLYPTHLANPVRDSDILMPIEPMFLDILAKVRAIAGSEIVEQIGSLSPEDKARIIQDLEIQQGRDCRPF